jgi:ATPase subunit of ABC transporter with duplicated ATPase domains
MIAFSRISRQYGRPVLFVEAVCQLNPGERVGLVGPNGSGETTLLTMVAGVLALDSGVRRLGASLQVGYFAQQALDLLDPDLTIEDRMEKDFPHESLGVHWWRVTLQWRTL